MDTLKGSELVTAAILSGFDAIWIDRFAYQDNGRELVTNLMSGKVQLIDIGSTRFAVIDVRGAAAELKSNLSKDVFDRMSTKWTGNGILIEWGNGFHSEEVLQDGRTFRWSKSKSVLQLRNTGDEEEQLCLSFKLASGAKGVVRIAGTGTATDENLSSIPKSVNIPIKLDVGKKYALAFSGDMPQLEVLGESRELYFYLLDLSIEPRSNCDNK